jgi:hypothetical protein
LEHVILCLFDDAEFETATNYVQEHADAIPDTVVLEISRNTMWTGLG